MLTVLAPWKETKQENKVKFCKTKRRFIGCHVQTLHISFECSNNEKNTFAFCVFWIYFMVTLKQRLAC